MALSVLSFKGSALPVVAQTTATQPLPRFGGYSDEAQIAIQKLVLSPETLEYRKTGKKTLNKKNSPSINDLIKKDLKGFAWRVLRWGQRLTIDLDCFGNAKGERKYSDNWFKSHQQELVRRIVDALQPHFPGVEIVLSPTPMHRKDYQGGDCCGLGCCAQRRCINGSGGGLVKLVTNEPLPPEALNPTSGKP